MDIIGYERVSEVNKLLISETDYRILFENVNKFRIENDLLPITSNNLVDLLDVNECVITYNQAISLKRIVKKGSKGIKLKLPIYSEDEIKYYKTVSYFRISETELISKLIQMLSVSGNETTYNIKKVVGMCRKRSIDYTDENFSESVKNVIKEVIQND